MATFADIKTAIAARLQDEANTAVSDATVGVAVNDALRFWKKRRFWFNTANTNRTLTINDPVIPLPTDFQYELPIDGFVIQYSNQSYRLDKVGTMTYDDANVRGVGLPYIYTWRNGSYLTYFYPDQAYMVQVNYVKDYDDLTGSGTNDFTDEADQLLRYEALRRLGAELRQDDMADYYESAVKQEVNNLTQRTSKQIGSGTLTVSTII